jgi:hypothetical protein
VEGIIINAMNDLKAIPQTSLNSASKSGKGSGRGALLGKGTILKGIMFNKLLAETYYLQTNLVTF